MKFWKHLPVPGLTNCRDLGGYASYGGGMAVPSGSRFAMTDGAIVGNTAVDSGGGVFLLGGEFLAAGGTASDRMVLG